MVSYYIIKRNTIFLIALSSSISLPILTLDTRSTLDILVIEAEYKYKNIELMFTEKYWYLIDHSVGLLMNFFPQFFFYFNQFRKFTGTICN